MIFSVAIPAYKPQFLKEAVESVLAQSYRDWELVIVDDCSPHNLEGIVSPYLADSRIKFCRNDKNFGAWDVVDNWNRCLEYCTGDYVICMGDDDRLLPCCLEDLALLIQAHPHLGVYHISAEIIDENGGLKEVLPARPERESSLELICNRWQGREQYIGDFCFDLRLLRKNGGFFKLPLAWGSDDVSSYIAAKGVSEGYVDGVANTSRPGFQYRKSSMTISESGNLEDKLKIMLRVGDWFSEELSSRSTGPENGNWSLEGARAFCRRHFKDVSRDYVKKDTGRIPSRLNYWLNHKDECRLSAADICYQFAKGLAQRLLGKLS